MKSINNEYRNASGTKRKIMLAYAKALSTTQYERITIKEVCSLAGINRSTFYRYYQCLGEIESEIENYVLTRFQRICDCTPLDDLLYGRKAFIERVSEELKGDAEFYLLLLLTDRIVVFIERINETIQEIFKEAVCNNTKLSSEEGGIMLTFIIGGRIAVFRRWILNGFIPSEEVISSVVEKLSLMGLKDFVE
ncbi:MAG: TetR/AcrR family transcriptional regulator [Clostridia bacterium]|nr:TetR/AcrR family transcriptional regulator [Clostridia bacterium]